ncbi:MAG: hypothetical protein FWC03_09135 [Treponema sp.]|nr:hypothetical protein [Treponema sp.]
MVGGSNPARLKSVILCHKVRKVQTLEAASGIENILEAIRRSELDSNDALQIVQALKGLELIDVPAVKSGKGTVLFTEFLETF